MNRLSFDTFFEVATGNPPYNYQSRLTGGDAGRSCESQLVSIPTGLGKTAAAVLAWLWNRVAHPDVAHRAIWPRRLVYCLPMRTLVEQTAIEVKTWIANILADRNGKLALDDETKSKLEWLRDNNPVILMGGEDGGEWDISPEENAILIGTQDMLLSRALNRGYGMSRYRWPMHFGLLNNDCLWVMDETQLMGPGLNTACQLEAFRRTGSSGFGSSGSNGSVTWYMSATNNPDHLRTREWRGVNRPEGFEFGLTAKETAETSGEINKRRSAVKRIELKQELNSESPGLVTNIFKLHAEMLSAIAGNAELPPRTLIICNTVDRAVAVYALLAEDKDKPEGCDLLLLHSRFRPPERRAQMERLKAESLTAFPKGQIVVATQVIEAGVDVSSGVLWSEVAPPASLVQRLGRLNRAGEFNKAAWKPLAVVFGVGVQTAPQRETNEAGEKRQKDNAKCCLPYDLATCETAWSVLEKLQGNASLGNLERIQTDIAASIPRCPYSLQRHELLDFFDTDANLSLGFTDVSPFVRGLDDDTDLHVLWRESWLQKDNDEGIGKPGFTPDYQRDEFCPVPSARHLKPAKCSIVAGSGEE
jgi:CRISPR-associated endonuclease/helicase Cas3